MAAIRTLLHIIKLVVKLYQSEVTLQLGISLRKQRIYEIFP